MNQDGLPSDLKSADAGLIRLTQDFLRKQLQGVAPDSLLVHAWEDFYEVHNDLIRRFARSNSVPESDIEDCLQDVWTAVLTELPALQYDTNRGRFRSWLFAVVRNKATDRIRRLSRQNTRSIEVAAPDGQWDKSRETDPAIAYEELWDRQFFEAVLAKLSTLVSETSYRVFVMRMIEQRSTAEVATALSLSDGQVRARYHRAHRKLKAMISLFSGGDFGVA